MKTHDKDFERLNEALYKLGVKYCAERNWDKAVETFEKLRKRNPHYENLSRNLWKARIRLSLKRPTSWIVGGIVVIVTVALCLTGAVVFFGPKATPTPTQVAVATKAVSTEQTLPPSITPPTIQLTPPVAEPTVTLTSEPIVTPTEEPTSEPTEEPSEEPTVESTEEPTSEATEEPTEEPTVEPMEEPTILGRIAFPVYDPERKTYDIYMANVDGSDRQRLLVDASQPALSPDGKRIAFRSWDEWDQHLGRGLAVVNLDGSDCRRITNALEDAGPNWYPDSAGFVFHSRKEADRSPRLYKVGAWVGAEAKVLQWESKSLLGDSPSLLGKNQMVYHLCLAGGCSLYTMNLDCSGNRVLVERIGQGRGAPAGSPDGSRVAFMTQQDGNWEIYVVNVDGNGLQRLTNDPATDGIPTWSPDGRYIAFASNRGGQWAIWLVDPDEGTPQKLFNVGGSIDGIVRAEPAYSSLGWIEESISWGP